jgi:hypothetical protein
MSRLIHFFLPTLLGLCILVASVSSQDPAGADPFVAVVVTVTAPVSVLRSGIDKPAVLKRDDRLYPGDRLISGEGGRASLIFADTAVEIKLLPHTELTLQGSRTREGIIKQVLLHLGDMLTHVLRGDMEVVTPTCVASVKGTQWWTRVDETASQTTVVVLEGKVQVASSALNKVQMVSAGDTAVVNAGQLLVNPTKAGDRPKDSKDGDQGSLDIDFQNGSNQPKTLHIEFDR